MNPHRRSFLVALGLLAASLPAAHAAEKAGKVDFPTKPIRLIVPFPPGGSNDVLGRYVGHKLTERVGEQIVIDNRGGANGIIGAELAANSTPDGYTMLMVSTSWVMNAALRKLPYDIEKSFDPITTIGSSPNSIVTNPGRFGTLRELVDHAKANPGKLSYASTGVGGFNHFGGELFRKMAKIDMVHVPYKGGGPAMVDIIANNIPVMFTSVTQVLPHVRGGRIRMLAVGAPKRSPAVPDVPTVSESGFPGYEVTVWWGLVTPHGVPPARLTKLRREINAVLEDEETKKRLAADAAEPQMLTPKEFRTMVSSDLKKWKDVAQAAGIKVN